MSLVFEILILSGKAMLPGEALVEIGVEFGVVGGLMKKCRRCIGDLFKGAPPKLLHHFFNNPSKRSITIAAMQRFY